jgi:uncharacterized protein YgiB involved in biofilm formation
MKRTKVMNYERFRKHRKVFLYAGLLTVPFISGCDQTPGTTPFSTISQCQQQYHYSAAQCRQIYGQAVDQAKLTGPQYRTQQDCVNDNRNDPQARQQCQYTHHGSTSHFFYVPRYYSYSPGSYAQPFYRGHGNDYRSASGKSFTPSKGGYTRPTTTARTVTRAGFGSSVASHSSSRSFSGGHSFGG